MRFNIRLTGFMLLLMGCGMDDDADYFSDITEPACWTVDGDPTIYQYVPEGMESGPVCSYLGKEPSDGQEG
jgi:hypothetical protein